MVEEGGDGETVMLCHEDHHLQIHGPKCNAKCVNIVYLSHVHFK